MDMKGLIHDRSLVACRYKTMHVKFSQNFSTAECYYNRRILIGGVVNRCLKGLKTRVKYKAFEEIDQ